MDCGLRIVDYGLKSLTVGTVSIFYVLRAKKWCVTGG